MELQQRAGSKGAILYRCAMCYVRGVGQDEVRVLAVFPNLAYSFVNYCSLVVCVCFVFLKCFVALNSLAKITKLLVGHVTKRD